VLLQLIDREKERSLWEVEEIFAESSALHEQAKEMPSYHPLAWDLLRKLLVVSPQARLNTLQAYMHPFFQVYILLAFLTILFTFGVGRVTSFASNRSTVWV